MGQKTSSTESDRYSQNSFEEGPATKKLKTGSESSQRETNQCSSSENMQKASYDFYKQMYAQFNSASNTSPIQLIPNNPVYNLNNGAQFSKNSPQKQKSNFFLKYSIFI